MTDKWEIKGETGTAPTTYGAPPPTYGGANMSANAPPAYNNPPPSAGYAAPPTGYTAPPATNPSYANQPVQNYNNPPQVGYVPPTQNYANPPGPSYANPPPAQNYASPPGPSYAGPPQTGPSYANPPQTGPSYASPPQTGPSYANPPPGGPSHTVIQTHTTVTQTKTDFTFGVCECFGNPQWCCYVCCCTSCAMADLRAQFDGQPATWWLTMLGMQFIWIFLFVPGVYSVTWLIWDILACALLMCIAQNMRQRLNITGGDGCMDCLLGFFCTGCRICQLGRELEMVQNPEARELVLNIQKGNPTGQGYMTQGRIM